MLPGIEGYLPTEKRKKFKVNQALTSVCFREPEAQCCTVIRGARGTGRQDTQGGRPRSQHLPVNSLAEKAETWAPGCVLPSSRKVLAQGIRPPMPGSERLPSLLSGARARHRRRAWAPRGPQHAACAPAQTQAGARPAQHGTTAARLLSLTSSVHAWSSTGLQARCRGGPWGRGMRWHRDCWGPQRGSPAGTI